MGLSSSAGVGRQSSITFGPVCRSNSLEWIQVSASTNFRRPAGSGAKDIAGLTNRPLADVYVVYNYHPNGFTGASLFDDYKIYLHFYFDFWAQAGGIAAKADEKRGEALRNGKLKNLVSELANLSAQLAMWNLNQTQIPNALAVINTGLAAQGIVIDDVFLLPGNFATNGLFILGNVEKIRAHGRRRHAGLRKTNRMTGVGTCCSRSVAIGWRALREHRRARLRPADTSRTTTSMVSAAAGRGARARAPAGRLTA